MTLPPTCPGTGFVISISYQLTVNTNHPVPGLVPTSADNNNYQPGFSSALMLNDLVLSQNAARHFDACTPLGAKATEIYDDFVQAGNGELDFAAIKKKIESKKQTRGM